MVELLHYRCTDSSLEMINNRGVCIKYDFLDTLQNTPGPLLHTQTQIHTIEDSFNASQCGSECYVHMESLILQ